MTEPREPKPQWLIDQDLVYNRAKVVPPEKLQRIARLLLPSPEVLEAVEDAFGKESDLYSRLNSVFEADTFSLDNFRRFDQVIDHYGMIFFNDSTPGVMGDPEKVRELWGDFESGSDEDPDE